MHTQMAQRAMRVTAVALDWNLILDWTISAGGRLQKSSAMDGMFMRLAADELFPDR